MESRSCLTEREEAAAACSWHLARKDKPLITMLRTSWPDVVRLSCGFGRSAHLHAGSMSAVIFAVDFATLHELRRNGILGLGFHYRRRHSLWSPPFSLPCPHLGQLSACRYFTAAAWLSTFFAHVHIVVFAGVHYHGLLSHATHVYEMCSQVYRSVLIVLTCIHHRR
ncbi:hypothetical protein MRX96_020541 [Rhipicephalus microplus]